MKEILYTIIFFFISFPCYSKWEKVHENKIFTEYFEVDAVKKINDIIFIWSLMDYKISNRKMEVLVQNITQCMTVIK